MVQRPLALDEKATTILDANARALLKDVHDVLVGVNDWTVESTEDCREGLCRDSGAEARQDRATPLRAALTGRATSPGIFDVLIALGRDESLGRIADQAR
jgi:glutamyl-tRNA synthetase